jgi:rhomboid family GlyGly-CTERM serine protease
MACMRTAGARRAFGALGTCLGHPLGAVVTVLAIIQLSPRTVVWLQFDRAAIDSGQWWRLVTGNFVHHGWAHGAANVGAFAALCWIAAGGSGSQSPAASAAARLRGVFGVALLAVPVVGMAVYWLSGSATYRGISGVDCALLAYVLLTMARQDGGAKAAGWLAALGLVAAKSIYEAVTGCVLLPTSAPIGVEVVGITHVVGLGAGGLGLGLAAAWRTLDPSAGCVASLRRGHAAGGWGVALARRAEGLRPRFRLPSVRPGRAAPGDRRFADSGVP